jgi:hypothetical protein
MMLPASIYITHRYAHEHHQIQQEESTTAVLSKRLEKGAKIFLFLEGGVNFDSTRGADGRLPVVGIGRRGRRMEDGWMEEGWWRMGGWRKRKEEEEGKGALKIPRANKEKERSQPDRQKCKVSIE